MTDSEHEELLEGLIMDALATLHHDGPEDGPIFEFEQLSLRKRFTARLAKCIALAPSRLHEREGIARAVCCRGSCLREDDCLADKRRDDRQTVDAILASLREPDDGATIPPSIAQAIDNVLNAEIDFRAGMPSDWTGDPLTDACDDLRSALNRNKP